MFFGQGYQKSDNFRNDLVCNSTHQNKKKYLALKLYLCKNKKKINKCIVFPNLFCLLNNFLLKNGFTNYIGILYDTKGN